ncbi:MAG: sigma factor-like helix-turn-helix DNA-binding protein [Myxococcales bacterium]|nr:hypothetical protein [Polyangiaceae bacterium]MDW8251945.1 sigma factor-like helix-turn-helix DNA-binding protein [Myxococcales bacterium]
MSIRKLDESKTEPSATEGHPTLRVARALTPSTAQPITREQRRSRRKRAVRARTISVKRMTKRELEMGRALYPETNYPKPRTRAECAEGPRPCPYVSCKYHLYLDVQPRTGAIKLNFPDIEVEEMQESCALDVADRGGTTLEEVGAIMNLTRERIRQLEVRAMAKVKSLNEMEALRDFVDEGPVGKRRLPVLHTSAEDREEFDEPEESDDLDDDLGDVEANDCELSDYAD